MSACRAAYCPTIVAPTPLRPRPTLNPTAPSPGPDKQFLLTYVEHKADRPPATIVLQRFLFNYWQRASSTPVHITNPIVYVLLIVADYTPSHPYMAVDSSLPTDPIRVVDITSGTFTLPGDAETAPPEIS